MKKITILCIILAVFLATSVFADNPVRSKGISIHALPKRVAKISGKPWGLQVSFAPYLKPEPGQPFFNQCGVFDQLMTKLITPQAAGY